MVKLIPLEILIDKRLNKIQNEKDRKHEEAILKKHKILNDDAQSIDSIKDSAQIIIHKKANDLRNDDTKNSKDMKNVKGYRSNNKMKI